MRPTVIDNAQWHSREPFPHGITQNTLPDDYYRELRDAFPTDRIFALPSKKMDPHYIIRRSLRMLGNSIPMVWKKFFDTHLSEEFANRLLQFLKDAAPKGEFSWANVMGKRKRSLGDKRADFMMDVEFVCCRPGTFSGRSKSHHIDSSDQIFTLMLFFPYENEPQEFGGGVEFMRGKGDRIAWRNDTRPHADCIEPFSTAQYVPNLSCFFLNGRHAIHGSQTRMPCEFPRRYIEVAAFANRHVFEMPNAGDVDSIESTK